MANKFDNISANPSGSFSNINLVNEAFHVFSKSPAGPTTSLGGARNKSGHTTTTGDVWADPIPAFLLAGANAAKFQEFSQLGDVLNLNDLCLYNDVVYRWENVGTEEAPQMGWKQWLTSDELVDGTLLLNKNGDGVIKYHKDHQAQNLTADNNNADASGNLSAKIYDALSGSTTFVSQFLAPTDKMVQGIPSLGYSAAVKAGSSLSAAGALAEGFNEDEEYLCNAYAGIIQFNKVRSQGTVWVSAFEYVGAKLDSTVAAIKEAVFGSTGGDDEDHPESVLEQLSNLDNRLDSAEDKLTTLTGDVTKTGSVLNTVKSKIDALDVVAKTIGGLTISQTDGLVSFSGTVDETPTESSTNLVTSGGIKTAIDDSISNHLKDTTNLHVTSAEKTSWNTAATTASTALQGVAMTIGGSSEGISITGGTTKTIAVPVSTIENGTFKTGEEKYLVTAEAVQSYVENNAKVSVKAGSMTTGEAVTSISFSDTSSSSDDVKITVAPNENASTEDGAIDIKVSATIGTTTATTDKKGFVDTSKFVKAGEIKSVIDQVTTDAIDGLSISSDSTAVGLNASGHGVSLSTASYSKENNTWTNAGYVITASTVKDFVDDTIDELKDTSFATSSVVDTEEGTSLTLSGKIGSPSISISGYASDKALKALSDTVTEHIELAAGTYLSVDASYSSLDALKAIEKPESNKIYLIPNSEDENNVKDEYIYTNGNWELIGTTAVKLDDVAKKIKFNGKEFVVTSDNTIEIGNAINNVVVQSQSESATIGTATDGVYTLYLANASSTVAGLTTVSDTYGATSTSAMTGKAVAEALKTVGKGIKINENNIDFANDDYTNIGSNFVSGIGYDNLASNANIENKSSVKASINKYVDTEGHTDYWINIGVDSATKTKMGLSKVADWDLGSTNPTNVDDYTSIAASYLSVNSAIREINTEFDNVDTKLSKKANSDNVVNSINLTNGLIYISYASGGNEYLDISSRRGYNALAGQSVCVSDNFIDIIDNLVGNTSLSKNIPGLLVDSRITRVDGNVAYIGNAQTIISPEKYISDIIVEGQITSWVSDMPNLESGYVATSNAVALKSTKTNDGNGVGMFANCTSLETFIGDLSSLKDGRYMFNGCTSLETFIGDLSSLKYGEEMFHACKLSVDSVECIAETIPVAASSSIIGIGIDTNISDEEKQRIHDAVELITSKNWTIYGTINNV